MDGWQAEIGGGRVRDRVDGHTFWTLICSGLLFITLATGFYVKTGGGSEASQPAPYDLLMVLTMGLTFAVGLRFPRHLK